MTDEQIVKDFFVRANELLDNKLDYIYKKYPFLIEKKEVKHD